MWNRTCFRVKGNMKTTTKHNQDIKEFLLQQNIKLHHRNSDDILINRTSMVCECPYIDYDEEMCYKYWILKIKTLYPKKYICWGGKTDEWIRVEIWE